jgi:tetratricopeptide (TPR) repeat protein
MSENDKARALYQQALPLFEKVGSDLGKANIWWSEGMLAWDNESNGTAAVEAWEKALRLYRKVSYTEYVANTLARMALAWNQTGQTEKACAALAEASAIAERLHVPSLSNLVARVQKEVTCPEHN